MADLGSLIDRWAALVPERGAVRDDLERRVIEKIEAKELPDLSIETALITVGKETLPFGISGESREHVLFQQKLQKGEVATVALRIGQRGKEDLEMAWLLFQGNEKTALLKGAGGMVVWAAGAAALIHGLVGSRFLGSISGPVMNMGGRMMLGRRGQPGQFSFTDGIALAITVDSVLFKALEEVGVDRPEVRVLMRAALEGGG